MSSRVAGVYTPAFVERLKSVTTHRVTSTVSLGFTPQPLLSDGAKSNSRSYSERVAGVYTPAFVERVHTTHTGRIQDECRWGLHPSLCLAPSHLIARTTLQNVSLGFTPQPLLSELAINRNGTTAIRVE